MKSESSIKNFTRGGQTLLHNFRMIKQIFDRVMIFCFILFVAFAAILFYLQTTEYQRYLIWQKYYADLLHFFNDKATQVFINPNGISGEVYSTQIQNASFILKAVKQASFTVVASMFESFILTLISFVLIYRWLRVRGQDQTETKKLRGDDIVDLKTINNHIQKSKKISNIIIGNLTMPLDFECRHILVHGTTGSGKSVCIRELLDQIRTRGDRAIIYDKGGSYISNYYRENTDIILNPLDNRTVSWHLWNECRGSADFDSLAAALMPMPHGTVDPFWISAARTIFAASARQMSKESDRSMMNLLKALLTADLATMEHFLRGTEAETLVSEKIEKTAISIKSVLTTYLKSLKYVKDEANPFSIRRWVQDDSQTNWVFISSLSDQHETLKPLISMWIDIAANSLMSLKPNYNRRIHIIIDEMPTLQKLPYLTDTLAESRKFGGCITLGMQSIAQTRKIYGSNAAEEISALCNTRLFFREPSFETAQWVSKELGQTEIEEVKEGISYSESAMRSGISISKQQSNRQIVSPSEIMRLNDLEAYVRVPGSFPITKINLEYKEPSSIAEAFIPREIDERNFNEINSLIDAVQSTNQSVVVSLENKPTSEEKLPEKEKKRGKKKKISKIPEQTEPFLG